MVEHVILNLIQDPLKKRMDCGSGSWQKEAENVREGFMYG
jgi:hypothetical protein